jgi:hypothetical protein
MPPSLAARPFCDPSLVSRCWRFDIRDQLLIAFKPRCDHTCHNVHPTADMGLYRNAMTLIRLRRQRTVLESSALADGPGAGLELVEDLQGALVGGGYNSGWHSIKSRAEVFVGFWHAPLFPQ